MNTKKKPSNVVSRKKCVTRWNVVLPDLAKVAPQLNDGDSKYWPVRKRCQPVRSFSPTRCYCARCGRCARILTTSTQNACWPSLLSLPSEGTFTAAAFHNPEEMDYAHSQIFIERLFMLETDPTIGQFSFDPSASGAPCLAVESVTRTSGEPNRRARTEFAASYDTPCLLNEAAHYYVDLGLPITLCPVGSKVPFSKDWGNKVWAHDEIDAEFDGRGPLNLGLILGQKSGLIDIEIDGQGGDAALLKLFHDDVPVTPMWRSARGDHRLFQWHEDLAQIGKASVAFDDLEFRLGAGGKAAQSLLPTSIT